MAELTADEEEVYRLITESRSQYERYLSTTEFLPPAQELSSENIGKYDWRHPVTIYTGGDESHASVE